MRSDNALIYYESVPSEASLDPIAPKTLVRPLPILPLLEALDTQRVPRRLVGAEVCRMLSRMLDPQSIPVGMPHA